MDGSATHPTPAFGVVDTAGATYGDRRERRGPDRRRRPTPVLSRYTLVGGRRQGDRRQDAAAPCYVDRYEPWLMGTLVAISLLCALDAVFTLLYVQRGGSEANPLMAAVLEWGPLPFLALKCGVTNLGLVVLCLHKNFRLVRGVTVGLLVVYALLFAYHLVLARMLPG
jgi:hypothetical protein